MTLTPSVRAISLCSFPCVARSFACASFHAISTLECLFFLVIAASLRPPDAAIFIAHYFVGDLNPQNRGGGDPTLPGPNAVWIGRARRLKLRPLFGTLCEVLVIIRDLKRHLLGYFVLHIIGKTARLVGAFAPVLGVVNKGGRHKVPLTRPSQVARTSPPRFHPINQTATIRRTEFVDGNRRLAHSVSVPTRRRGDGPGLALAL